MLMFGIGLFAGFAVMAMFSNSVIMDIETSRNSWRELALDLNCQLIAAAREE